MRKADLQFIKDTLDMHQLFAEASMQKTAQDFSSDIFSKIKSLLRYDPANPVESILAFIGPGILWMLGLRLPAIIYSAAEALGMDWEALFVSIKEKLRPILHEIVSGKSHDSSSIQSAVEAGFNESKWGEPKPELLSNLVKTQGHINNMLFIKKIARRWSKEQETMIEQLSHSITGNRLRRGMTGFFIRIFSWVITAVVIAAGFRLVGGFASNILGIHKDAPGSQDGQQESGGQSGTSPPSPEKSNVKLFPNPNADPKLLASNFNDASHLWIIEGNIKNIQEILIQWAQQLYPQLIDNNAFKASSAFQKVVSMFEDRNKGADNLDILAIPRPFTSIKDIVDAFAASVAERTQSPKTETNPEIPNTREI